MKSLVRGGVILITLSLFAVFVYAQTRSEKVLSIANDSHKEVTNNEEVKASETDLHVGNTDKKLVKTTAMVKAVRSASRGSFSATAYSMLPKTSGSSILPAMRMTNKEPMPWSKMISGGTRESIQVRIQAIGCCSFRVCLIWSK